MPGFLADWRRHGDPAVDRLFDRYGDIVSLPLPGIRPGVRRAVAIRDPEVMKELISADPDVVDATDGNRVLEPLYGDRSLFLVDGPEHRRLRKILLPPLRDGALEEWRGMIEEVATRTARDLPVGTPVALHPRMLRASLEVILRITISIDEDRLEHWLDPMDRLLRIAASEEFSARYLVRQTGALRRWPTFRRALDRCERLVRGEIARRRGSDEQRHDLLGMLLSAPGEPLSDDEVRDQLFTLLIAGHETTATTISWAVERLLRHPEALARLAAESRAGVSEDYARAVVLETVRLRPPVLVFARVTRAPYRLKQWQVPPHTLLLPYIRALHEQESLYADARAFRPERFLDTPPGHYTYLAFGGGPHRCLGDRLAVFESAIFLHALFGELELDPDRSEPEALRRKAVTLIPGRRARVVVRPHKRAKGP